MVPLVPPESTPQKASRSVQPFCTAHCRVSSGMPRYVFCPKNCAFAWSDLQPHLIHGSFGPSDSKSQLASRWFSRVFAKLTAQSRYTLQRAAPSPLIIVPSHGGSEPPSNTWSHPSPQLKRHHDRLNRFCTAHWCDRPTDRPTDHASRSVTVGRIYVRSTVMRPKNTWYDENCKCHCTITK